MTQDRRNRNSESNTAQPSDDPQVTQERTITQVTPDSVLADDGRMANSAKGASPTPRELEQDVMITNPSADSMESRG